MKVKPAISLFILLTSLLILIVLHLHNGKFIFDFTNFKNAIFSFSSENQLEIIYREIRIPRTMITIVAGASLAISGLLLQTFFNNALAGPSVLGITSGASLFVALSVLSTFSFLHTDFGIILSSFLGALFFSLIILLFSIYVKNKVSLLLIGLMLGSFANAFIQIFQITSTTESLKIFTLWGFGSLQQVAFGQLGLIFILFLGFSGLLLFLIKPLNLLVIGEKQAKILGLNIRFYSVFLIFVSSLFAGLVTAFCGPISFIGLAVPNIAKYLFKTQNHLKLIAYSALIGVLLLMICDLIILYLENYIHLPLNAVTALIGSPFVIWIILKRF